MVSYLLMQKHLSFNKRWEKLVSRIESLNRDSLEEYDHLLNELQKLYKNSSARLLQRYLQQSDEYWPKLQELHDELESRVNSKFNKLLSETELLIGDPEKVEDVEAEKKYFEEAVERLKLLSALHKRWDPGRFKDLENIKALIAKKHTTLLRETNVFHNVEGYREKLELLDKLSVEIDKLYDWYFSNYLNVEGENKRWWHDEENNVCLELPDGSSWIPVHFRESDIDRAPLEHIKHLPKKKELKDMKKLLNRFLNFYHKHGLISHAERYHLRNHDFFRSYSEKYSLFAEDADERLKAALLEQLSRLHAVIRDVEERFRHKSETEQSYCLSFAAYFAPVDEVYRILLRGCISSKDSVFTRTSGFDKGLPLKLYPHIHNGDIGFIFPVTKLCSKYQFLQFSSDSPEIHLFNNSNPEEDVRIDIRDGIFIAPKHKHLHYELNGRKVTETYESYFRKFFHHISKNPPRWFDPSRTDGWLSRHCIFYDHKTRKKLLQMIDNKSFVHIMNKYTNRKVDNLAFFQVPGKIAPTNNFKLYDIPDMMGRTEKKALTLFRWVPEKH